MKPISLFTDLLNNERTAGMLLVICTIISLLLANSPAGEAYLAVWHLPMAGKYFEYWINDGLMAIFFLMIGLELEREIYIGELSDRKQAMLPIMAAFGGMLVPAGIHMLLNHGTPTASGAGIPMATDIAFAIGILALLGDRVPLALKVFLTALAVIDDLGAIFTIAIFYSTGIDWAYLGGAMGILLILFIMNRAKVMNLIPYLALGVVMWYLMLHSGVHATVTGVLVAFAIPFGDGSRKSISARLQHFLHRPVSYVILPLFALANTGIVLESDWFDHLFTLNGYGIFLGLVVGKPLGIGLFCLATIGLGVSTLPPGINWKQLLGAAMLAGIGFTMSIFITLLAFDDLEHVVSSKTTILVSSLLAAVIGFAWLRFVLPHRPPANAAVEEEAG
ncbi:MAG: Na+/H+ antiporter NhaA [Flavobacteriales bacterium]|jgi:NhaA family Na+:H+ antiporter|nr:Na+/H+ antiporter NhaA [Flavobacteriales bacterium]MCB0759156.1 Na+/H+ antiporter NhaA [Flavobacteriales bacterium]